MSRIALKTPFALSREGLARRIAREIIQSVKALARALLHRREVMRLTEFSERELKDIGLLPGDVTGALAQPLHVDPSRVLLVRRVERKADARRAALVTVQADAPVELMTVLPRAA